MSAPVWMTSVLTLTDKVTLLLLRYGSYSIVQLLIMGYAIVALPIATVHFSLPLLVQQHRLEGTILL